MIAAAGTLKTSSAELAGVGPTLASDIKVLARLHDRELDTEVLEELLAEPPSRWFSLRMRGPMVDEAYRLIAEGFKELGEADDQPALDNLAAEYAAIYLTHAYRSAPTESVWRDEEGLERQVAMFMVRKWYDHYGIKVPNWRVRSDDHLVHELEFLAFLLESSADIDELSPPARFLREHPLVWIPEFCRRVVQRCKLPLYAGLALLTAAYLEQLAEFLGALTGDDMTPAPLELQQVAAGSGCGTIGNKKEPTCGDPPERYVPGAEPSW